MSQPYVWKPIKNDVLVIRGNKVAVGPALEFEPKHSRLTQAEVVSRDWRARAGVARWPAAAAGISSSIAAETGKEHPRVHVILTSEIAWASQYRILSRVSDRRPWPLTQVADTSISITHW